MSECSTFHCSHFALYMYIPRGNSHIIIALSKKNGCFFRQNLTLYISIKTCTYDGIEGLNR